MKNRFLFIALIFITHNALAQNVSLKRDTIFNNKRAYAIFKKDNSRHLHYFIYSIDGRKLIEIHYGHLNDRERQRYVVTFLNDNKQAMVTKQQGFPISFIKEVVKYKLIDNGLSVNDQFELQFINANSLPDGYTDVDRLIEY